METVTKPGIATIGLGVMGTRMLASLTDHGGFRLVTAWDPSPDAVDATARLHPDMTITDSADEAIEHPDVDVVYIACPPATHHGYALAAAKLGKLVYCEKPLGVDVAKSEALLAVIANHGVINAVNFPFAATPAVDLILQEIESGSLGDVIDVDIQLHFTKWPRGWQEAASWLSLKAEGGFVREVGSHFVFLTEKLFGRASLESASTTYPTVSASVASEPEGSESDAPQPCETSFLATLSCSGLPVSMVGSAGDASVSDDIVEFIIRGSEKSLRLSNWAIVSTSTVDGAWQPLVGADPEDRGAANQRFFDEFLTLASGNASTIASFEDALSVQRIVEAILSS